jgi:hypothetical protein
MKTEKEKENLTNRRTFLSGIASISVVSMASSCTYNQGKTNIPHVLVTQTAEQRSTGAEDRVYWVNVLTRIANPVMSNLAARQLKAKMPVEAMKEYMDERKQFTHLEAFGRTLSGIAPWLELDLQTGEEANQRRNFAEMAREALDAATDPKSPDFMNFTESLQPLVDASYLAFAILRAPNELWKKLDPRVQRNVVAVLKSTRVIRTSFSNWLLFPAIIEAALYFVGETDWDKMRVDYAIRQFEQWYQGDGVYSDGPELHWDYYNSYVIHPMLVEILNVTGGNFLEWSNLQTKILERAQRHAAIQERLISPEGTYPPIGRSLAYRFGAFQILSQIALMHKLPKEINPAQVRSALTAVIRRTIEAPDTFDADGWLQIGLYGHQPAIAENYVSTGSLYMCTNGLVALGLSPTDEFWIGEFTDWTSRKIWSGQNVQPDKSLGVE